MSTAIPTGITSTVELITPETALDYLATHKEREDGSKENRRFNQATADGYARDMAAGNWTLTNDAITFDRDGHLRNGQHRLTAVVESETTQPFLVLRGLPPENQANMDTGRKRTVADALHLRGGDDGKWASNVAALASLILERESGLKQYRSTPSEQLDLIDRDPMVRAITIDILGPLPKFAGLTKTWAGYCYWRLDQIDSSDAAKFFDALSTLENLPSGSPILALHRRLMNQPKGTGRSHRDAAIALVFAAWNAWRKGEERDRIQTPGLRNGKVVIPEPK